MIIQCLISSKAKYLSFSGFYFFLELSRLILANFLPRAMSFRRSLATEGIFYKTKVIIP